MDELLAKVMQGVDPDDPSASIKIFLNLMAIVPWEAMIIWQVVFIVVGALLGWWKGRFTATVLASLLLGPFGWAVPFLPRRPAMPPPLPGSKKR